MPINNYHPYPDILMEECKFHPPSSLFLCLLYDTEDPEMGAALGEGKVVSCAPLSGAASTEPWPP